YVLAAAITNCAFRRRHRWNAVLNLFPLGKWMVLYRSFCMRNGYFTRRFSAESHCLWSDGYLSAETEKGINMVCCRLISNAPRSCTSVENALTNRYANGPFRAASRFGRLWYDTPNNAIGYTMDSSRSHHAVIYVYDDAGNMIETHEYKDDSKSSEKVR